MDQHPISQTLGALIGDLLAARSFAEGPAAKVFSDFKARWEQQGAVGLQERPPELKRPDEEEATRPWTHRRNLAWSGGLERSQ